MKTNNKKILIVAAHPDDEILGCGGTVARLVKSGYEAYTLILGEGITSRDAKRDTNKRKNDLSALKVHMNTANKIIGVTKVFTADFPDNAFDSVPLLAIVKEIEKVKTEIKPEIIFTHYENDLNIDHKLTYQAVLTATRPMSEETVKAIYAFEILSSTEWSFPLSFSPNIFYDISKTLTEKTKAMKEYTSELREFPHPRSLDSIVHNAKARGSQCGFLAAEAFVLVREIK